MTAVRAVFDSQSLWWTSRATHADSRRVAIALSGGLDSTVLLDAVVRVAGPSRCVALHVHHGLSANADAWLDHARACATRLGVTFDARRVDLSAYRGTGIEAAARDARYRALFELGERHRADTLMLAHHADDQAETFLLQALRGAGLRGLASMPAVAEFRMARADAVAHRCSIVRPLLDLPRAALHAYALRRGLSWIDDESNDDPRYARNALRHAVLVPLSAHFASYREGLARSARHAADAQALLDEVADADLQSLKVQMDGRTEMGGDSTSRASISGTSLSDASKSGEGSTPLSLSAWRELDARSARRAANVLRYWIRANGLRAMSVARFDDLLAKLRTAVVDRTLSIVHEGATLRQYRDVLDWSAARTEAMTEPASRAESLGWAGHAVWRLPAWRGTLVFVPTHSDDPDRLSVAQLRRHVLHAVARRGGERMRIAAGRPSRSLKHLFQEAAWPAWRRDVPLIFLGDRLLYVPGIGLNRDPDLDPDVDPDASAEPDRPSDFAAFDRDAFDADWCRLEWRGDLLIA
ncbi:tRNA lysidine(34) synthetase TilS [Pararobbsia silviterrae]|uniref:tRNA lysidine(34) synthetase TilS n=1 Tax=Pararobbsia silviterrae TaxID=1792498 RepID=UPI003B82CFA7